MANGDEQAPDTTDGNPFSLLAYVLFKVRHAIEDREDADRPPRWIRIARGAQYKEETLGSIVGEAVNGMAETLSYMAELTLDLEELLYQTDAAKAMAEVMLRLIQAATDRNFQDGIETLVGASSLGGLGQAMTDINRAATEVERYLQYIPEPEDVRGLGHELYRLLCIVQRDFPRKDDDNAIDTADAELKGKDQLIMDDCGKVRLCAWSYAHGVTARGLGPNEANEKELFVFGARRLYKTASNNGLPQDSEMTWVDGEDRVRVFAFDFASGDAAKKQKDIKELIELLQAHGYNSPALNASTVDTLDDDLRKNLMKFQAINDLPITGEVDNDTINRLMNLDFARKNLRRARPYDASFKWPWGIDPTPNNPAPVPPRPVSGVIELINPGADTYRDEGLALVPRAPHPYYIVPISPAGQLPPDRDKWPKKQGWLSDASTGVRGFVALHSRLRNRDDDTPGRFLGGRWSEGEANRGRFFFAARHVEPWRDGRSGQPGADALFGGNVPSPGSVSRMFQWIPLPAWLAPDVAANTPDGTAAWELHVYASVMQRSLFADRGGNGYPDQGRIALEAYGSDVFTQGTVSARDPAKAKASTGTELYPDHAATTAALRLEEVDRKRLWTWRAAAPMKVPAGTTALCLVAEGVHQSAYDIDAYFDDFRVFYVWEKIETP